MLPEDGVVFGKGFFQKEFYIFLCFKKVCDIQIRDFCITFFIVQLLCLGYI